MTRTAIALTVLLIATAAHAFDSREETCIRMAVAELSVSQNSKVVVQKVEASIVKITGPVLRLYAVTVSVQTDAQNVTHVFRCRDDGNEIRIVQRKMTR